MRCVRVPGPPVHAPLRDRFPDGAPGGAQGHKRLILSSLSPSEIRQAINEGNVPDLQRIKGIGAKSAQRIIVDLKGKISATVEMDQLFPAKSNTIKEESLSALVNLGFAKKTVENVLEQVLKGNDQMTVEELIKEALKKL